MPLLLDIWLNVIHIGVLAVTRSLGDASMKEFVVGAPYTTETTLDEQDEFLIVACDGVCLHLVQLPITGTLIRKCLALGCMLRPRSR